MWDFGSSHESGVWRHLGVLSRHIAKGYEIMMLGAKTCRFRFGATGLLCIAFWSGVLSAQTPEAQYRVEGPRSYYEYYIYPGDVLRISVSLHPELSKTAVVTPNGEITLAWLKAAKVVGLTARAASDLLNQKVRLVVDGSCVTVTVQRRNGPWVLQREPYFIDVPTPSHIYANKMRNS